MITEKLINPPSVLVMCLADPSCNPRPRRAIDLCIAEGFDVSVVGYPPSQPLAVKSFIPIPYPSLSIFYRISRKVQAAMRSCLPFDRWRVFCEDKLYGLSKIKKIINGTGFDLLIVEDLYLLPLAFEIKGRARILFDAREYYPRQNEDNIWFALFEKHRRTQLCRDYLRRCDAVVTVSEGLRQAYWKEFGVLADLYRSTPPYADVPVGPVSPNKIRMVYHGAANRNRKLENLIEVMAMLDDRFLLDFILVGGRGYQHELRRKASSIESIAFLEPVSFSMIIPTICKYDIGFFYYEPTGFNILHSLPNKLFEYIQARLMLAIGPSPDMAALVSEYGCGVVADTFSIKGMAKALNSLTAADIEMYKMRSDRAARDLCFEKESKKMVDIMSRLLKN